MNKSFYKKLIFIIIIFNIISCSLTSIKVEQFYINQNEKINLILLNKYTGPILFQRIKSADWEVDREGLIDLKDEKSIRKKLIKGKEPISIYFYNNEHPIHGRFIIDSGVSTLLGDTCHTKFGLEENVVPGEYAENPELNRKSLTLLKNLSIKIPKLKIYPGHQSL